MPRDIVVLGPPGTGKTESMITVSRNWLKTKACDRNEIAYLAFTKAAAGEAASRIIDEDLRRDVGDKMPYFRTLHSLAYRGMRKEKDDLRPLTTSDMKHFAQVSSMQGIYAVHEYEDLSEAYSLQENFGRTEWDKCLTAYTLSRISARNLNELTAASRKMCPAAEKMSGWIDEDQYRAFIRHYETYKKANGLLDFTDMLAFGLTEMQPLDDVKYVVIDEAQDLAPILFAIVDRLFRNAKEIWWAGDDDQCQPTDTKVLMSDGSLKDISDVSAGDRVVSYDRRGAYFVDKREVLKTSKRLYTGRLVSVKAGGRATRATIEHRFIVRWTDEAREGKKCVTYLMEKNGFWRVGWCQLFNAEGALHLNIRANNEGADRVWILKVHDDRTDASVHESIVAARYGIPTVTFEPVEGASHMTKEALAQIFDAVGDRGPQAERCLEDHGRSVRYPLIDRRGDPGKHRTTIFETQVCNLIPEIMTVPVRRGEKVEWAPIDLSESQVTELPVFSLEVDKSHTYVADGIVTHNCLYTFAAADARLFIDRARKAHTRVFLRDTHRFGIEIVNIAGQIIRQVRNRVPKEVIGVPGRGHVIHSSGEFKPIVAKMLLLHRHVMGCQALASTYFAAGLPFRNERGRDPLGASQRMKAFKAMRDLADGKEVTLGAIHRLVDDLMPSVLVDEEKGEKKRLVVHGAKKKLQDSGTGSANILDLMRMKILTEDGADLIRGKHFRSLKHADDLEYYDRVIDNGYSLETVDEKDEINVPVITTIHGAKGRQSPRVVVFNEMGRKCGEDDMDTEHRLAYVAATRTSGELEVCSERMVDWAEKMYEYPLKEK
jgi:hypothetical protein